MTDLRGAFSRVELAEAAERLLADRRKNDAEAVTRKLFTADKARRRERCALAVAETMRAIAERRDPGDADERWYQTGGAEGAPWAAVRADLAATFDAMKTAALTPGADPALEEAALKVGALKSWFQPFKPEPVGHMPAIIFAYHVEQAARRLNETRAAERAAAATAPRPRQPRPIAGGLFA